MQHASLGISGEFQATVLFLNDHCEEAVFFQVGPQLRRQVSHLVGDSKVVSHAARFFNRAINKRLFFGGQLWTRVVMQLFPVRVAAEQVAFPPGGTSINRFFLSARHRRHHFAEHAEHRC